MRIEELIIGDWVNQKMNDGAYQVQWIEREIVGLIKHTGTEEDGSIHLTAVPLECISPIPLTAEILVKNGFECIDVDDLHCSHYRYENMELLKWDGWVFWKFAIHNNGIFANILECRVSYIHQLQHALRLAGVEKEIDV